MQNPMVRSDIYCAYRGLVRTHDTFGSPDAIRTFPKDIGVSRMILERCLSELYRHREIVGAVLDPEEVATLQAVAANFFALFSRHRLDVADAFVDTLAEVQRITVVAEAERYHPTELDSAVDILVGHSRGTPRFPDGVGLVCNAIRSLNEAWEELDPESLAAVMSSARTLKVHLSLFACQEGREEVIECCTNLLSHCRN